MPAPVDALLFLKSRSDLKHTMTAVLISSEAGYLHWWSISGPRYHTGKQQMFTSTYFQVQIRFE